MRQKKDKILIVALTSLVLFSSSLALMMYLKQGQNNNRVVREKKVVVYVSANDIKKGALIKSSDIEKKELPKSYVSFSLPVKEEIVGKFAKVDMLKGEPYRMEKLTTKKQPSTKADISLKENKQNKMKVTNDSVSLSLQLFRNIDYSLKKDDYIDIVSIKEYKTSKQQKSNFRTKYVALHIKVLSFSKNGEIQNSYIKHTTEDDKKVKTTADTISLDMSPKDIKNLLIAYYNAQEINKDRVYSDKFNTGHLWIIKTKKIVDENAQKMKNNLMIDKVAPKRKASKRKRTIKRAVISYEKN